MDHLVLVPKPAAIRAAPDPRSPAPAVGVKGQAVEVVGRREMLSRNRKRELSDLGGEASHNTVLLEPRSVNASASRNPKKSSHQKNAESSPNDRLDATRPQFVATTFENRRAKPSSEVDFL